MTRLALRSFAAHKLRTLSIAFAVFLGVSLVAGTLIYSDTINRSFSDIFDQALEGTDVVVSSKEVVQQDSGELPSFGAGVLDRVRGVEGVEEAAGGVFALVRLVDSEGEQLGNGFAPNFVISTGPERFSPVTYVEGGPPRTAAEASVDAATAERAGLELGDRVGVAGDRSVEYYEIVGFDRLGETSTGGSASATLVLSEAQRVSGRAGKFDTISIAAAEGVDPGELAARVERVLPSNLRSETAAQSADRQSADIEEDLAFLPIFLLVMSGVILVVAAFLIFNTFSITVAQRIREFGLLRTLGASRRQILFTVVGEAALIGAVCSALGIVGGIGAAEGLAGLFSAIGVDLPNTGMVFAPGTAVAAVVIGLAIPLVASLVPALRATRVTPMAALHEAELPESRRRGRIVTTVAVLLALVGFALVVVGLFGGVESSGTAAGLGGGGAALVLFAVSLFSPRLVRPLASLAGRPLQRIGGLTGRLARENAMRKPGRTAVTAAALMIGLALVTFVAVFVAGINDSTAKAIERNLQGDLIVQNTDGFNPIPPTVEGEVAEVEGVAQTASLRSANAKVVGERGRRRVSSVDPASATDVLEPEWAEGSDATIEQLRDGQAVVDQSFADDTGIDVGDTMRALTATGDRPRLEVVGRLEDDADFLGDFVITESQMAREFGERRDRTVLAVLAEDADSGAVQQRVEGLLERRYPSAEALDQEELKDATAEQLAPVLALIYGLLALAIIVSAFGIANTLALSIHERTRELGLLRAIGMSRRQVRRLMRYEAVITALIGALLGTVLGVVFAALVSRPLADEGFELSFPYVTIVALFLVAALVGVLAAIGPARRASRLDVLDAVAYE